MERKRGMGFSDYKDIVYAQMHSAVDHDENDILVDYTLSVQETLLAVFARHIRKHGHLSFLHPVEYKVPCTAPETAVDKYFFPTATPGSTPSRCPEQFQLGSWLRSWTDTQATRADIWSDFRAAGVVPCLRDALPQDNNSIINVHGFSTDTIESTLTRKTVATSYAELWTRLLTVCPELGNLTPVDPISPSDDDGPDLVDVNICQMFSLSTRDKSRRSVMRTLGELCFLATETGPERIVMDKKWTCSSEDECSLSVTSRSILAKINGTIFLLTSMGKLGTIDWQYTDLSTECAVASGDQVWILFGCNSPMILRPHGEEYTLISRVRIPGCMDGQAVGGPDIRGPFKPRDICNGHEVKQIQIW